MKIEGPSGVSGSPLRVRRTRATRSDETFSAHIEAEEAAAASAPVVSLGPIHALVALQEVDDSTRSRRGAVRDGHDILDELERLKLELLEGHVSGARLEIIAGLVRRRREACVDPRLQLLIAEIDLRAAVELAKLGRAP